MIEGALNVRVRNLPFLGTTSTAGINHSPMIHLEMSDHVVRASVFPATSWLKTWISGRRVCVSYMPV